MRKVFYPKTGEPVFHFLICCMAVLSICACSATNLTNPRLADDVLPVRSVLQNSEQNEGRFLTLTGAVYDGLLCDGAPMSDPVVSLPHNCIALYTRNSDDHISFDGLDGQTVILEGQYSHDMCGNPDAICTGTGRWLPGAALTVTRSERLE